MRIASSLELVIFPMLKLAIDTFKEAKDNKLVIIFYYNLM